MSEPPDRLDVFVNALVDSLKSRFDRCLDSNATPRLVLLAVLNAVADARKAVEKPE
jgi:hypothetical protein